VWESLSMGKIAFEAEVILFYDAFKVGLERSASAREKKNNQRRAHLKGYDHLHF
jgi:hypothetical protein